MRPPARPNRYFYNPLDTILGTEGAVRILRMLGLQREGTSPLLLAVFCSLGRPGTWKALRRLEASGIIERYGGRTGFPHFRIKPSHPLTRPLTDLFQWERAYGGRQGFKAIQKGAGLPARSSG